MTLWGYEDQPKCHHFPKMPPLCWWTQTNSEWPLVQWPETMFSPRPFLMLSHFAHPVTSLKPSFPDQGLYSAINLIGSKQSFCVSESEGPLMRPVSFFHNQMIHLHKFKIKSFSLTKIITLIIGTQTTVSSEWIGSKIIVFKPSRLFLFPSLQLIIWLAFSSCES